MTWKDELVGLLKTLKNEPLGRDRISIGITVSVAAYESLQRHIGAVNSRPVAWVGPGFLTLSRVNREDQWVWVVFELSPEEVIDSACGEVDFLSL